MGRIAEFAALIIDHMNDEDHAGFDPVAWFDGISAMQAGGYEDLETVAICDYIAQVLA